MVTLGELDRRVNRAASGLQTRGAGPGTGAAIVMPNRPEWLYLFFATQRLGAYAVSVNTELKGDSLRYVISHCDASVVVCDPQTQAGWLNEQASSYVAPGGDPSASRVFDHPGLRVFAASPEHLLAMKALAARPRDAYDIRRLAEVLNLHTVPDVLALVRKVFPEEERQPGSDSSLRISSARATERPAHTPKTRCVPLRGRTLVDVPSASTHRLNSGSDLDELAAC